MDFVTAKQARDYLEAAYRLASDHIRAIKDAGERGRYNLTPDSVRFTPEYQDAKARVDTTFADLRRFNAWFVPTFKREIAAERKAHRG